MLKSQMKEIGQSFDLRGAYQGTDVSEQGGSSAEKWVAAASAAAWWWQCNNFELKRQNCQS
jgi:hypothetical protein